MAIKSRQSISRFTPLLLAAIIVTGCTGGSEGSETGAAAELRKAREKWEKAGFENYVFQFRWQCFCIREYVSLVELKVKAGNAVSGSYVEGGGELESERLADYMPIDQLFDLIQEAIDRDAHSIRAEYDPELGFPVDVYIDYNEMMADEEKGFTIERFVQ
jgi:hypothetical protein